MAYACGWNKIIIIIIMIIIIIIVIIIIIIIIIITIICSNKMFKFALRTFILYVEVLCTCHELFFHIFFTIIQMF